VKVSWDDDIPNMIGKIKMFQTTNQKRLGFWNICHLTWGDLRTRHVVISFDFPKRKKRKPGSVSSFGCLLSINLPDLGQLWMCPKLIQNKYVKSGHQKLVLPNLSKPQGSPRQSTGQGLVKLT
jgi:hypothetical protein